MMTFFLMTMLMSIILLLPNAFAQPSGGSSALIFNTSQIRIACSDNDVLGYMSGSWACAEGGSTSSVSLQSAFENGPEITGADSQANAFIVGDELTSSGWRFYVGTSGPTIECFQGVNTCDYVASVASGDQFLVNYDSVTKLTIDANGTTSDIVSGEAFSVDLGGSSVLSIDNTGTTIDALSGDSFILSLAGTPGLTVTSAGAVTLGEALKEIHSAMFPAGMVAVDGAQCVKGSDVTLNAEVFPVTITCTDSDAATMKIDFPAPEAWDEAYLTISMVAFQDDANPDGNINIDWSGYCAGDNDPFGHDTFTAETANGAMDFAASGYATDDLIKVSTTGQVPIGTCAEGDMVRLRGQVDATGTTAATPEDVHILWLVVKIKVDDWSN